MSSHMPLRHWQCRHPHGRASNPGERIALSPGPISSLTPESQLPTRNPTRASCGEAGGVVKTTDSFQMSHYMDRLSNTLVLGAPFEPAAKRTGRVNRMDLLKKISAWKMSKAAVHICVTVSSLSVHPLLFPAHCKMIVSCEPPAPLPQFICI